MRRWYKPPTRLDYLALMRTHETELAEVKLLEPVAYGDSRGLFFESFNRRAFIEATGCDAEFVQDNHSRSGAGVVRGIHYQRPRPQGKLIRCVTGAVWDVAVDLRRSSDSFGQWTARELTAENRHQLWIPPGFGHGFAVLSDSADVLYKVTEYFDADGDRGVRWDDERLGIDWPISGVPTLSAKDASAPSLSDALVFD